MTIKYYDLDREASEQDKEKARTRGYLDEVPIKWRHKLRLERPMQVSAIYPTYITWGRHLRASDHFLYGRLEQHVVRIHRYYSPSVWEDNADFPIVSAVRDSQRFVWTGNLNEVTPWSLLRDTMKLYGLDEWGGYEFGFVSVGGEFLSMRRAREFCMCYLEANDNRITAWRRQCEEVLGVISGNALGPDKPYTKHNSQGFPLNAVGVLLENGPMPEHYFKKEELSQLYARGLATKVMLRDCREEIAAVPEAAAIFTRYYEAIDLKGALIEHVHGH